LIPLAIGFIRDILIYDYTSEHRKMKIKQINKAPEDPRIGNVSGGSYARERSSGVFIILRERHSK
jgi:hypothetical protein